VDNPGADQKVSELQASYDAIAEEYARRIYDELTHKPLDRQLLDRFAASVRGLGPVCDMGCGPGHVARYLKERGVDIFGIDLAPKMVEQAKRLNPGIDFKQGNMYALEVEDDAWGGIAALYSIIHSPRERVAEVLNEFKRVLRPGGLVLLAFHLGDDMVHLDDWWGLPVSVDTIFFRSHEMEGYLKSSRFEILDIIERPPYENVEYQSHRAYILARKPMSPPAVGHGGGKQEVQQ
jgi:SAM-dependent methyltransferase